MPRGGGGGGGFHRMADDEKPKDLSYWKVIKRTAPLIWPENMHLRFRVGLCATSILLGRVANLLVPQMYKGAVDSLTGSDHEAPSFPTGYILAYAIIKMYQNLQRDIRGFAWLDVEQDTSKRIKLTVFQHLHSLPLEYHLSRKTGEVLKVVERGAASLQSLLNMTLFTIGPTILDLILVCIVLMIQVDFIFSIVIFSSMMAYMATTVQMIDWRKKFRREMIDTDNNVNDKAVNSLLNFETVKYFAMEQEEVNRMEDNLKTYYKAAWMNEVSMYLLNASQHGILNVGGFICMYLSAERVMTGAMTVGDFVMIQVYMMQLAQPLSWLGTAWRVLQQGFIDMEKMFALLDVIPAIKDAPGASELQVQKGRIEFDKVTFSYNNERRVLNGVTFEIPGGTRAAFVGKTGAGKSTIARLLFRFYDLDRNTGGSVRIDSHDIRDITQHSLRKSIGVVPQDTVLFNDTIRYNLLYGKPDATEEELIEAAKGAAIWESIEKFPDGLDTKVGERGLRLSGGEKQRVAIARTILKNPRIVLLDEATSALDTHTEHHIQEALDRMSQGRTTVTIAHRLSTIVGSDQIFVMQNGQVLESGSHTDLMSKDGEYASMWARQATSDMDGTLSRSGSPIVAVVPESGQPAQLSS